MSTYSYKCPNCSGPLEFKPELSKLKCDYCGSEFRPEEIDKLIKDNPDLVASDVSEMSSTESASQKIKGYNCKNCGAEVVTSDTTLTTFCYYCHSPVVITDRAQGKFKPDKIIPFKIDKKKAEEIFLSWVKGKRYVKKSFYSQTQLEKITGMYLPYWSLDSSYRITLKGKGRKIKTRTIGRTEYTETSNYDIDRTGSYEINNLSEIAYSKIDKKLLDSITPFNFEEVEGFRAFYLNGFFSETYDKTFEQVKDILKNKSDDFAKRSAKVSLNHYNNYSLDVEEYEISNQKGNYLLLPTWIMTYDYNDKKYVYAMNGQTGKAFGELPIDNSLIVRDALLFALIIVIFTLIGGYFIW